MYFWPTPGVLNKPPWPVSESMATCSEASRSMPIFSVAMVEFFGDEIDTMGYFDPVTQRRVENADELVILPVAETLPALHPGGIEGLARELDGLLARQRRRKTPNEALMRTLQADADALRGGLAFSAADRYQALIYPESAAQANSG